MRISRRVGLGALLAAALLLAVVLAPAMSANPNLKAQKPSLPEIDFTNETVVAVFFGEYPCI